MKKLLIILLMFSSAYLFAQTGETKPATAKVLQTPNNPTFNFNVPDTTVGINMGTYKYMKLAGAKKTRWQLDSLANKLVPYTGATGSVDLGTYAIKAKEQLLPIFNGACIVPDITNNGNGSVTISSGEYHLSNNTDGRGSKNYIIAGNTFTLTDGSQNYVVVDYNAGTPILKVILDVTLINETTVIPVYSIFRNGIYLHIQYWDALGLALANKIHKSIIKTQRYRRESGLSLSEYGTRNLSLTSGIVWTGVVPVTLSAMATATDPIFFWYHVAGVWTQSVVTQYNNTQWDNGTNLVTLTANRYAVNWVFRGVESSKHLYVIIGRGDYTETQAISATLPAIPAAISSHAVLVGKLIVQKNATTALSIQSAFDVQFGLSAIQSHGDLTGRDVVDSHPAGAITNTPYSTIAATNIQTAINELADEKVQLNPASTQSGNINLTGNAQFTGNVGIGTNPDNTYSLSIEGLRPAYFSSTFPSGFVTYMKSSSTIDTDWNTVMGNAGGLKQIFYATGNADFVGGLNLGVWKGTAITGALQNASGTPQYYNGSSWVNLAGTSQWTNETYGIKYASNVGIGVAPLQTVAFTSEGARPAYFNSTSAAGYAAYMKSSGTGDLDYNTVMGNAGGLKQIFYATGNADFAGGLVLGLWNGTAPTGALRNYLGTPQYYNGSSWVSLGGGGGSMVYPGAGISVSTGSAWGTSLTDNSGNWNTAYNDKINSASFSTATGVVTLTQQDAGTVTVDIDGRYLESVPDNYLRNDANDVTTGTITATNFILSSDRRLKRNIEHINSLEWCDKIKFVQFNMKNDTVQRYGVIAQQIEKLNPDMVYTDKDGIKSVAYIDLIIAKLASMDQRITILESESVMMKDQIKRLKNRRK